jgi:hypothetical protein
MSKELTHEQALTLRLINNVCVPAWCTNVALFTYTGVRGLVETRYNDGIDGDSWELTDAGQKALAAYDREWVMVKRDLLESENLDRVCLDRLIARLRDLAHYVTLGPESVRREFSMRIPAEPARDADLVLFRAAKMLEHVKKALEAAP